MPRESKSRKQARLDRILEGLKRAYPDAHCELNFSNPLELLIATILSAQCTDKLVNRVTASLFQTISHPPPITRPPHRRPRERDPSARFLPE